ncbi:MAG TPA: hypothetical protein ACFE0H_09395 [Elainellaceae cyanobacterium]
MGSSDHAIEMRGDRVELIPLGSAVFYSTTLNIHYSTPFLLDL